MADAGARNNAQQRQQQRALRHNSLTLTARAPFPDRDPGLLPLILLPLEPAAALPLPLPRSFSTDQKLTAAGGSDAWRPFSKPPVTREGKKMPGSPPSLPLRSELPPPLSRSWIRACDNIAWFCCFWGVPGPPHPHPFSQRYSCLFSSYSVRGVDLKFPTMFPAKFPTTQAKVILVIGFELRSDVCIGRCISNDSGSIIALICPVGFEYRPMICQQWHFTWKVSFFLFKEFFWLTSSWISFVIFNNEIETTVAARVVGLLHKGKLTLQLQYHKFK